MIPIWMLANSTGSFIKNNWKEILVASTLAFAIYTVYDYGYDRGAAKVEAKYAAAVAEAQKQAKAQEDTLKGQVLDLSRKLEITDQNVERKILNETTSANATIRELTRRLQNSKCTDSSPEDRTSSDILNFAAIAAETANFNYGVGLKNAQQVSGLQVYTAGVIKACQNGTLSIELQAMRQTAQERLKELSKTVETTAK